MKRLLPLSLLAITACLQAAAGTLSGTVTYQSGPSTANGVSVHVSDSLGSWNANLITDVNGQFSVAIPSTVATTGIGAQINVVVMECGVYQKKIAINSGSPVVNFSICSAGPAISGLNGNIYLGKIASPPSNSGAAKVYLVSKTYDPVMMDTVLTALDSISTTSGTFSKSYTAKPNGNLVLKAMLMPGNPNYANYLPTYHGFMGTLTPNQSQPLTISNFTGAPTDISLVAGVNPGGPGFIGGHVSLGANKTSGVGDPLSGRALMLKNKTTGQAVAWTQSDAAGQFSFPSVPYGTYELFGDQFGKVNPKLLVTVSASSPRAANIVFEENDTKFAGKFENVGVSRTTPLDAVKAFPNPATDLVRITGLSSIRGAKTIVLQSMTGAEISRQSVLTGDAAVETAMLPGGIYTILVHTEQGSTSLKLTK